MKKTYYILSVLALCLSSCFTDRDDFIPTQSEDQGEENDSTEVDESLQFVTEEGEVFYTGLDCNGTGDYIFNEDLALEDLIIPENLPDSLDLSEYLPPIGNQGRQGSCTSWAVSYYMKSLQEKLESGLAYDSLNIMSPSYTYNQLTQGNCTGTAIEQTLQILKDQGVSSLKLFPYTENDCSLQPDEEAREMAMESKISDFRFLTGENMTAQMKTLITEQKPIIIGTVLTSEFGKKDSFGITAYREHVVDYDESDCHAMLVIGFNDRYQAFKVVNSWGEDFGDDGFVWIDYQAFENTTRPNASFRVISQAAVAYDF